MINHLLFDLDNTLYPSGTRMEDEINSRMIAYISGFLDITETEAAALRKKRIPGYGTTLEWLRGEYNLTDTDGYFRALHPDEETDGLPYDADLRPFLQSLGMPMSVLTNSPMEHALRVLKFYDIDDLFVGIYDLKFNSFKGKPHPESYLNAVRASGFTVEDTLFFDDHIKYVKGYAETGGTAVLVDADGTDPGFPCARIRSIYEIPSCLKRLAG